MIDYDEWFAFGLARRIFSLDVYDDYCGDGIILPIPSKQIYVDYKDEKYKNIRGIKNWVKYGYDMQWKIKTGCIVHVLKAPSFKLSNGNELDFLNPKVLENALEENNSQNIEGLNFDGWASSIHRDEVGHHPSLWSVVREMTEVSQGISQADLFIDIGCGKGLPLYIANQSGYYNEFVGIDIDHITMKICKDNLEGRLNNLNLLIKSADSYILPDKKAHIYFFCPFSNSVLVKFLENNIENIRRNKSVILYNNNYMADHVLKMFGFVSKVKLYNEDIDIYVLE